MSAPVASLATKVLVGGAASALAIGTLKDDRAWLSHPTIETLENLPSSMRGVAESAALLFARAAKGSATLAQSKEGAKRDMSREEEVEYFLKPEVAGWRF